MGKEIYQELCKMFKFGDTNKCNMHNLESVQDKEMHKIMGHFEIQTNHLISTRLPDLVIVNSNKRRDFTKLWTLPSRLTAGKKLKERGKIDKLQDFDKELKKLWNMKVTVIPLLIGTLVTVTRGFVQGLEDLEKRGVVDTKLQQNTEKGPGDLRRLAVAQSLVGNRLLTLV